MSICIIAVLKSSDEALDRAHLFLQELVRSSRQETECIRYDAFRKNGSVTFVEIWSSAQVLEAHKLTAHFQALTSFIHDTGANLEISIVEQL